MDQITYLYFSSSSSSSSSNNHPPKTIKSTRPSYINSLHSLRKPTQKPITKQFIAPLTPTPRKVYNVKPSDFKQVVHMLTSTPKFQSTSSRRLKDVAPPPLVLSTIPKPSIFTKPPPSSSNEERANMFISKLPMMDYFESLSPLIGLTLSPTPQSYDQFEVALVSPLGLNLSPSSVSWCWSVLRSPNNLSGFNSPII